MTKGLNLKRKLLLLTLWIFMATWSRAQPSLAFYPMQDQFNSFDYNPAFLTSREKFSFSILPIGGSSVGYNNQEIIHDMTSKVLRGVITNQDYKNVFSNMVSNSTFHQNVESGLFSFTMRSDIGFFNFRIKDSQYFMASVEGETTRFIFKSDIQSAVIGQVQRLPAQAAHYREYSLGYAYKSPSKRLKAGIRAKLYFGKFAFQSNITGAIEEDPNQLTNYVLRTSGLINISFPENTIQNPNDSTNTLSFSNQKIVKYLFNSGNPGLGVDLGINYSLSPSLSFSASIIDLGKIKYKTNLNSRTMDLEKYPISKSYELSNENGVQIIRKREGFSYADSFDFSKLPHVKSDFSMPVPTFVYAGLEYKANPNLSFHLTDRVVIVNEMNYNSLALAANFRVSRKLSISSGYSVIADSYFNLPLALLIRGNVGQFFVGTDNFASLLVPSSSDYAGFSFGACFYLFPKRDLYLKASDHTPFYKPRKTIKNPRTGLIIKEEPDE